MLSGKKIGRSNSQPFWVKGVSFLLLIAWLLFDSGIARAAVLAYEPESQSPVEHTNVAHYQTDNFQVDHHFVSLPEDSESWVDRESKENEPDDEWKICCDSVATSKACIPGNSAFYYTISVTGRKSLKFYILYHSWKSYLS